MQIQETTGSRPSKGTSQAAILLLSALAGCAASFGFLPTAEELASASSLTEETV
jgi:hypothetical protein